MQARCYEEIQSVFGDSTSRLSERHLLPYTDAFLHEVMRFWALLSPHSRECYEDCQLGNYLLPKGTQVMLSIYRCHYDPTVFPEPTQFKPEHFLTDEGQLAPHKRGFLSFGAGTRVCLGESIAKKVTFLITVMLVQAFDLGSELLLQQMSAAIRRLAASQTAGNSCSGGYWQQLLDGLRRRLLRDSGRGASGGGPVAAANSALRHLCGGGGDHLQRVPTSTDRPPISAADFAELRRLFDSPAAVASWGHLGNAWPKLLLERAGRPLTASLLEELERQVGLEELAVKNPGLLASMAESRLRLLGDPAGSRRCVAALSKRADPAVRSLLTVRMLSLLRQLPDAAELTAVWDESGANTSEVPAESFESSEQLFAYFEAAGRQRRDNAANPLLPPRQPWDIDERLVAEVAAAPDSWGDLSQLLVEPACRHGLLFSQPAALRLARLLLDKTPSRTLSPSTALEATMDRRCASCGRSLSEAYSTGAADSDQLDAAGLASRLLELRQASGQPVWRTDPDEAADFRQWLRHKTARNGRPGAVLDLNNLLLHLGSGGSSGRAKIKPDYSACFSILEGQLPLSGRPLRHLVFVGKLVESKHLFTDEFFRQFRMYCSRARLVSWPGCYMISDDQFREQRKHLTPADSEAGGPHRLLWPPGYPTRCLTHADGAVHLLCAASDDVADDLSFWPSFRWVCVPLTAA
uniref:Cytochrome P450 n=1 Tax=Macrostomum lignano TaxID=282301 RepID=A0A1I8GV66_9PLAT